MAIFQTMLFFLSCGAIGHAFVTLVIGRKQTAVAYPHSLSLAFGFGFGLISYVFFLVKWITPDSNFGPVLWFLLVVSLLGFGFPTQRRVNAFRLHRSNDALVILLAGGCATAAYIGVRQLIALPHGDWDAWSIWNMHARFLVRGGTDWTAMFSPILFWTHGDYPLLLPALTAAGWQFTSSETVLIPGITAVLFSAMTIVVLTSSLKTDGDLKRGILGGLVLIATPSFWLNGTIQTADVPAAFFILVTIVLAWPSGRSEVDRSLLLLSGFGASLVAWTKNEGLLFVVAFVTTRFLVRWFASSLRVSSKEIAALAAGAAPGITILFCFKALFAPVSEFAGEFTLQRIFDLSRYGDVLGWMIQYSAHFGTDSGIHPVWVLITAVIFLGPRIGPHWRNGLLHVAVCVAVMLFGYSVVYQLSPHPLEWHIESSIDRLLLQLWPALLFAVFASLEHSPEQQSIGRRRWLYAVTPVLVSVVAFAVVARTFPTAVALIPVRPPREQFLQVLPAAGLRSTWARMDVSSDAAGWIILRLESKGSIREAISPPVSPALSGVIPVLDDRSMGVVIVNAGDTPATVQIDCGNQSTSTLAIREGGKIAALLHESPLTLNCVGAVRFQSSTPVAVTAFHFTDEVMMQIPVAHSERLERAPVHLPYIDQLEQQTMDLVMTNPTDVPLVGRYRVLGTAGTELASGGYEVPAGGTARYLLSAAGRIEVLPIYDSLAPDAFAILNGSISSSATAAGMAFRTLVEHDVSDRLETRLALINPGSDPVRVNVEISGMNREIIIAPRTQAVHPATTEPTKGIARITSDQPIAITALRMKAGQLWSTVTPIPEFPVMEGVTHIFPHVVTGAGYSSEFAIGADAQLQMH